MTAVVRISETYDLSTQRNKLGLIGIHTPPRALLERHFGPMMRNYRFAKLLGCDVTLVPTAQLPLDPNGIGTGAGQVAPQDSVNPILYKAVSNSHFETLISKIYGGTGVNASSDGSSLTYTGGVCDSDAPIGMTDLNIYYGILSQPKGWRKAFWNTGFHMGKLKPLMYQMITNYGNEMLPANADGIRYRPVITDPNNAPTSYVVDNVRGSVMRGRAVVCPALPLWGGLERNTQISSLVEPIPCNIPVVYVGAVIIPPTTSLGGSRFYFRMRVTWTVKLLGLVSYQEHSNLATYNANGAASYWSDYTQNSKMDSFEDSADVAGMDIEKVMESGS